MAQSPAFPDIQSQRYAMSALNFLVGSGLERLQCFANLAIRWS